MQTSMVAALRQGKQTLPKLFYNEVAGRGTTQGGMMIQRLLIVVAMMIVTTGVAAQSLTKSTFTAPRAYDTQFWASSAAYWAGVSADIASSRGGYERNPLLRNRNGGLSVTRALAISAIPYGLSLLTQRRHRRIANVLRWAGGAGHGAVAAINFTGRTTR